MNSYGIIILGFIILISVIQFIIELGHMKRFSRPVSEHVNTLYPKAVYLRYIDKQKRSFLYSSIQSFVRLLLLAGFVWMDYFSLLDNHLDTLIGSNILKNFVFVGVYFLIVYSFDLGVSFIEEVYSKKRNRTKKNMMKFFKTSMKTIGANLLFGALVLFLVLFLYEQLGLGSFVILLVVIEVVVVLFSLFFTKVIVPLFYTLKPLEEGELREQISIFLRQENVLVDNLYVLDQGRKSSHMNAFVSGFSSRKRIVLYDTLLRKLSNDEIVAVLAHELGHQKKGHILFNIGLSSLFVLGLLILLGLVFEYPVFSTSFGFSQIHYGVSFILYIYLLELYLLIARMLLSINSRRFEYQADQYAAEVWYKESLINALVKIAKRNVEHLTPHPVYAMIYYSHPSLGERIEHLSEEDNYE